LLFDLKQGHCPFLAVSYRIRAPEIKKTDEFDGWLAKLRDARALAKILSRIQRLELGNAGDVKPVGDGISEMRIDYGPGYRVYYKQTGKEIVLLLCGGDKSTQDRDIKRAKQLAAEL
jgi:putative addiction module killer protein